MRTLCCGKRCLPSRVKSGQFLAGISDCPQGRHSNERGVGNEPLKKVDPAGLEPATSHLAGECSIQLSYGSVRKPRRWHQRGFLRLCEVPYVATCSPPPLRPLRSKGVSSSSCVSVPNLGRRYTEPSKWTMPSAFSLDSRDDTEARSSVTPCNSAKAIAEAAFKPVVPTSSNRSSTKVLIGCRLVLPCLESSSVNKAMARSRPLTWLSSASRSRRSESRSSSSRCFIALSFRFPMMFSGTSSWVGTADGTRTRKPTRTTVRETVAFTISPLRQSIVTCVPRKSPLRLLPRNAAMWIARDHKSEGPSDRWSRCRSHRFGGLPVAA